MLSLGFNDFLIELSPKPASKCASRVNDKSLLLKQVMAKAGHGWTGFFKSSWVTKKKNQNTKKTVST